MSQSGPSGFRKFFSKNVDEDKVEEEILSMVEEGLDRRRRDGAYQQHL